MKPRLFSSASSESCGTRPARRHKSVLGPWLLLLVLGLAAAASAPCLVLANTAGEPGSEQGAATGEKSHAQLLTEASQALVTNQFPHAIALLDQALLLQPSHPPTLYRRATAHLSVGRSSAALADLDALLAVQPGFGQGQAHVTRASILAKEGELEAAKLSLKQFGKHAGTGTGSTASKAKELEQALDKAVAAEKQLGKAVDAGRKQVDKLLAFSAKTAAAERKEKLKQLRTNPMVQTNAHDCIAQATTLLEIAPSHLGARRSRAECHLWKGDVKETMADWSRISMLSPSADLQLQLSALAFYLEADLPTARKHLKTCLTSDPDNKRCAQAHRRLKNYEKSFKKLDRFKESGEWRAVLSVLKGAKVGGKTMKEEIEAYIEHDLLHLPGSGEEEEAAGNPLLGPLLVDVADKSELLFHLTKDTCKAHVQLEQLERATPFCEQVLQRDPENADALTCRGEQAMKEERYEDAIRDFGAAFRATGNSDNNIRARLLKAQKRHKLASTKDYYKVLGVARDADERTIKKAYRGLARLHHPDKGGSQEKMAQINEAFGVLGDAELRQKYDAGDDPNDPMAQAGQGGAGNPFMFQGGGHPFAQFFQQQGGGGGQQFFKGGSGGGGQQFQFHFG